MLETLDLKRFVAAAAAHPKRTVALEAKLNIGTGFHDKWYRSQKEHWLGWLVAQELTAMHSDAACHLVQPGRVWSRLKCSPMMYWLAEVADIPSNVLDSAEIAATEAASINSKDGNPHGKFMRRVLPWEVMEAAIISSTNSATDAEANLAGNIAFSRLSQLRAEFRKLALANTQ